MRPMKYHTAVPCALIALLLGPLSACADAAAAAPDYAVATRTVKFGDLDLTRGAGAATLYSRIQNAAAAVCEPALSTGARESILLTRRCKEQAIARAVGVVNAPALTSYHLAKSKQAITLARQP